MHSKGFVHGNLHPDHFVIGKEDYRDTVYLLSLENVISIDNDLGNENN